MPDDGRLPVEIVTGFLGAGKTTLLRREIEREAAGDTAILVNEFGEIGLDQLLFQPIAPDVVLLDSGCVCCQVRGEVRDAVVSLIERRARGETPPFRRIVVETSGLAEPAPLLSTFLADPVLANRCRVVRTIAVVDARAVRDAAERPPEWTAQAAAADGLAMAKLDLVDDEAAAAVRAELHALNPTAAIFPADDLAALDAVRSAGALGRPAYRPTEAARHGAVDTAWFRHPGQIDFATLGVWLSAMLHFHGDKVLRTKGLIDVGAPGPLVLNGVQHVMHRPEHLAAWPDEDRESRIVFITRNLPARRIVAALERFLGDAAAA